MEDLLVDVLHIRSYPLGEDSLVYTQERTKLGSIQLPSRVSCCCRYACSVLVGNLDEFCRAKDRTIWSEEVCYDWDDRTSNNWTCAWDFIGSKSNFKMVLSDHLRDRLRHWFVCRLAGLSLHGLEILQPIKWNCTGCMEWHKSDWRSHRLRSLLYLNWCI